VSPASPGGRTDATVEVPFGDGGKGHWASVWPEKAYRDGVGGHVVLRCDVDRHGVAERCQVVSETPPNKGFGAAALALRPTFRLTPAAGPDGPTDSVMTIAVDFPMPKPQIDGGAANGSDATSGPLSAGGGADLPRFGGPEPLRHNISLLDDPVWASTVSYEDLLRAYPAQGRGAEGYAVAHCQVHPGGALADCQIIREDPEGRGFGKAALGLAARFRVAPEWSSAPKHADVWVDIPIRFPPPGAPDTRVIRTPYWVSGFDPDRALKIFPKEAADKGLSTGVGVAECIVMLDGSLTNCAPKAADPEGLGFSESVVELASTMRMNPWMRDGEPVDGAVTDVRVRLNLRAHP
jgi:TonB family protein